jgi:hypothetical protein
MKAKSQATEEALEKIRNLTYEELDSMKTILFVQDWIDHNDTDDALPSRTITKKLAELYPHHVTFLAKASATADNELVGLVEEFNSFPNVIKVFIWGKLTCAGLENLKRARAVHQAFAKSILAVYGCVVP